MSFNKEGNIDKELALTEKIIGAAIEVHINVLKLKDGIRRIVL